MNALLSSLVLASTASALGAQAAWTSLGSGTPPARAAVMSAADPGGLLVFGGNLPGGVRLNELWRFDGVAWSDLTPATGPAPAARQWGAASFDVVRNRLVVFGGNDGMTYFGDTWEFDLGTGSWSAQSPATSPTARRWCAMAFDTARGETVLFGGQDASGTYLGDTWVWDGTNWSPRAPANAPAPIGRHRMASRFVGGEMLLYGGRDAGGAVGETWIWDGANWTETLTSTRPSAALNRGLFAHGLAYDEIRERYIVYGGVESGGTRNDTWEFDGVDWTMRSQPMGPSRSGMAMGYLQSVGKTIMFGGFQNTQLGDTWEYQTGILASVANGAGTLGCTSSGGMSPAQSYSALPWGGDTVTIQVAGVDLNAALRAILLNFGPPIAPIPLSALGFPNCSLLAGPSISLPLGPANDLSLALPATGLAGGIYSTQAVVVEAVPFTVSASERLDAVIGAR